MKPAAYTRISGSQDQLGNQSLPTQQRLVFDYAARSGLPAPALYEESRSAYTDDLEKRPVFAALVAAIERGDFDLLIIYDQDRLARDAALALMVANRLTRAGCRLVLLNQPGADLATPDGRFIFTLGAGIAEYQSAQISRKSRAGLAHIRATGGHIGGLPFGAVRDADRRLVLDPARADALRRLLELAAELPFARVAMALTAAGVPTARGGPRWGESAVRAIVAAGGWLRDRPDPWPALWSAARRRLPDAPGNASARRYPLTGLIRCGCGGVLLASTYKQYRDGTRRRTVVCRNRARGTPSGGGCPYPHTYADRYERAILAWTTGIPDLRLVAPLPLPDAAVARAALAGRRRVAGKLWEGGAIGEAEYDARIAAIDAEDAALPVDDAVETLAEDVLLAQRALFDAGDAGQNAIYRALGLRFVLTGRDIAIVARPALGAYLAACGHPLSCAARPD